MATQSIPPTFPAAHGRRAVSAATSQWSALTRWLPTLIAPIQVPDNQRCALVMLNLALSACEEL